MKMRYLLMLVVAVALASGVSGGATFPSSPFGTEDAGADVYVRGYTKSNGTYVAPHRRSNPNSVKWDNYSY